MRSSTNQKIIMNYLYLPSPIPAQKAAPSTPPSMRASSVWPSGLAREPPQLVQRRKYDSNVNGLDTDTAQKKTRGCLSYISSLRNRQTTTTLSTVTREPATTTSSFNATSYCFRKPNLISSRYQLDLVFNNVKPKDWYFVLN